MLFSNIIRNKPANRPLGKHTPVEEDFVLRVINRILEGRDELPARVFLEPEKLVISMQYLAHEIVEDTSLDKEIFEIMNTSDTEADLNYKLGSLLAKIRLTRRTLDMNTEAYVSRIRATEVSGFKTTAPLPPHRHRDEHIKNALLSQRSHIESILLEKNKELLS